MKSWYHMEGFNDLLTGHSIGTYLISDCMSHYIEYTQVFYS